MSNKSSFWMQFNYLTKQKSLLEFMNEMLLLKDLFLAMYMLLCVQSCRYSTMVLTEQTGLQNLYSMLRYCISESCCRRAMIARHFGEQWNQEDCAKMCDVCVAVSGGSPLSGCQEDVTNICLGFLDALEKNSLKEKRLTALKLVEAWKPPQSMASVKKNVNDLERVLIYCVIEGVLKEEFHFTPYSTISYITPARKAAIVQAGKMKVIMDKSRITAGRRIEHLPGSHNVTAGESTRLLASTTKVPHHSTRGNFSVNCTDPSSSKTSREQTPDQVTSRDRPGKKRKLPVTILEDSDFVYKGTVVPQTRKDSSKDPWLSKRSKGKSKAVPDDSNPSSMFSISATNSSVLIELDSDSS